jgi:hypothetical protein
MGERRFVERAQYYRALGVARDKLCAIMAGDFVKVVPSADEERAGHESLWLKVERRDGSALQAVSEEGAPFAITVDNVVDVLPAGELVARPHECLQCLGAGRDLDAGDRKLLADVRSVGFHVLKVPADDEGPAFAFTVGLHHRFGHPELVVVGLDLDTAHSALNRLGKTIADGNYPDLDGVLEGTHCELREPMLPDVRKDLLGYARWFYRSDDFPVRQLFWPGCEVRL